MPSLEKSLIALSWAEWGKVIEGGRCDNKGAGGEGLSNRHLVFIYVVHGFDYEPE